MPFFAVIDNRTGAVVLTADTYTRASDFARRDTANLYVSQVYRPGELRL